MQGIKNILDNLELIGHPVDDGAIVIHTLNGLGPAYIPLASAIRARDTPITFEELYDKLLDHEAFPQRDEAKKGNPVITAQFNQRTYNRKGSSITRQFSSTAWQFNTLKAPPTFTVPTQFWQFSPHGRGFFFHSRQSNSGPTISSNSPEFLSKSVASSSSNNNSIGPYVNFVIKLVTLLGFVALVPHPELKHGLKQIT
jgi:hypothetical protein